METLSPVCGEITKQEKAPRYKNPKRRSKRNGSRDGTNTGATSALKAKWADPVWRAQVLEKRKAKMALRKGTNKFRAGVPDGMRKPEADKIWAQAEIQAQKFIQIMEDAGELDKDAVPGSEAEMAKRVLAEAYKIAVGPGGDVKVKVTAQRMILDFTKAKPETKSKLTLDKSEEWLAALALDMSNGGSGQ